VAFLSKLPRVLSERSERCVTVEKALKCLIFLECTQHKFFYHGKVEKFNANATLTNFDSLQSNIFLQTRTSTGIVLSYYGLKSLLKCT
jgi:hypothetical protein